MRKLLLVASFLVAAATSQAQVNAFALQTDVRSVSASGQARTVVVVQDNRLDPPLVTSTEQLDRKALNPLVHSGLGGNFNTSDGLSLRTSDATLDGQGAQRSLASSSQLGAELLADVFANGDYRFDLIDGVQTDTDGQAGGSANASVQWQFDLTQPTRVLLQMSSNLDDLRAQGSFSLIGSTGFAWTDPYFITPDGDQRFSFLVPLLLPAGNYQLSAEVRAGAFAAGPGGSSAARSLLSFDLQAVSVVPEPASALLLMGGLLTLAARARRGRA